MVEEDQNLKINFGDRNHLLGNYSGSSAVIDAAVHTINLRNLNQEKAGL
ncbi:hypothetical protein [Bacillus sp. SA1-12]|nr:hypothetical protein [Bacillus sp. SA1-12]